MQPGQRLILVVPAPLALLEVIGEDQVFGNAVDEDDGEDQRQRVAQ
jgi:hypothetical protein